MSICIHCDLSTEQPVYILENQTQIGPFCCEGCLTVFSVIQHNGLSEYYKIKHNSGVLKKRAPAELSVDKYSYLDDADFLSEYSYKNASGLQTMEFYLEGIHCLACLWIVEKLPSFVHGVHTSKLDMSRSVVTVVLEKSGRFSEAAAELSKIGYRPHALKINQDEKNLKLKENRSMLLRIGIAAAASGNIMLYAVSLYAGAGVEYQIVFNAMTVVFALPVLTFSAWPFYRSSYLALKKKSLSIDVPISIALIMGALMGLYNLYNNIPENYFDSLTALVFLLLLSRYFLKIIQEKGLSTSDMHFFYQGENILRKDEGHDIFSVIHPKFIKVNDILKIKVNQLIPADAIVTAGQSYTNNSLLTGESQLQRVAIGDEVFSGTMNVGSELLIRVNKVNRSTRLGNILKSVEDGWSQKSKIVGTTNTVSKYFVAVVFMLAVVLFVWKFEHGNFKEAFEAAMTLLIVTCPCALAIATPLTFYRTLVKCTQRGIIIKDDAVIEKISKAKNIFIDKTGTLTQNKLTVSELTPLAATNIPLEEIIYGLEKSSRHPVGKCLMNSLSSRNVPEREVLELKETAGLGVSGFIDHNFYEIHNYTVYENKIPVATFSVSDSLRTDSYHAVQKLKRYKIKLKVLSGDKSSYVKELARRLDLESGEFLSDLTPEAKAKIIKNSSNSVMIGDGANDSIALSTADTGIAVHGAMDISLRAADVYLNLPGLNSVIELMTISRETMKVVYRNLILSLGYNSASVFLAFTGHISPLTAAIIMPLSSLTVLLSTLTGTKKLRAVWKS